MSLNIFHTFYISLVEITTKHAMMDYNPDSWKDGPIYQALQTNT
jgi:hypothetical protein